MRVLIVSKYFPPFENARAQQMATVAKALGPAGCEVAVVAGLAPEVAETPVWDSAVRYVPTESMPSGGARARRLRWGYRRFVNSWRRRRWPARACRACLEVLREFRPDVMMTASMPDASHQVGLLLRRKTRIPWVAFFSDPRPPAILPGPYRHRKSVVRQALEMRLIRQVLRECTAVVMTSRYALPLMESGTGVNILRKSFTIPHVASQPASAAARTDRRLVHLGDLTPHRVSGALLEAVKLAAAEIPDRFGGLLCVGNVCEGFRALSREMDMEGLVACHGYVPESKAKEFAAAAHALLVLEADMAESPFLPRKFADYAATGRPIIAITPPASAIRDYMRRHGGGVAAAHNPQEIAAAIRAVFANGPARHEDKPDGGAGGLAAVFSATAVGAQYVELFDALCREAVASMEKGPRCPTRC